jgi:hypothetical protein
MKESGFKGKEAWPGGPTALRSGEVWLLGGRFSNKRTCTGGPKAASPLVRGIRMPRRKSCGDSIVIPLTAWEWNLSEIPFSARLRHLLHEMRCERLGSLHGLRYSQIIRYRNVGKITVRELIAFVNGVQQGDWGTGSKPEATPFIRKTGAEPC